MYCPRLVHKGLVIDYGEEGSNKTGGGHVKFYPYEKGGGGEVDTFSAMLKGGGGGTTSFGVVFTR